MQQFKAGDKVICVDERYSFDTLSKNKIYTVYHAYYNSVELVGERSTWCADRFQLYSAADTNQEITVESALAFLISQGYTVTLSKA